MTFGKRLKYERENRGWSQIFLSQKTGISNAVLSHYEREIRNPDPETIKKLATVLEVSADYLLGLSDYKNLDDYKKEKRLGADWTDEEKAAAEAFILQMRNLKGSQK